MPFQRSHSDAVMREVVFHLIDDVTGLPKLAQTFATTDLQIRKPGASSYVNCDATQQAAVVELGGGDYVYTLTVGEIDTVGIGFVFKTGKANTIPVTAVDEVSIHPWDALPASHVIAGSYGELCARPVGIVVGHGSNTTMSFRTNLAGTNNYWKDGFISFLTGALANQVHKILAFVSTDGVLAVDTAFTGIPANGDRFIVVNK